MGELYKQLMIPEIQQYRTNKYNFKEYEFGIVSLHQFLSDLTNRHKLITYITFINRRAPFDVDFISTLLHLVYTNQCAIVDYDKIYKQELVFINASFVTNAYSIPSFDSKIKDVVTYYHSIDKPFADYIKSIHCMLWIIRYYQQLYYDSRFNECHKQRLKELMTEEVRNQLYTEIQNHPADTEDDRLDLIADVILDSKDKYTDLYEETFYTSDWNLMDLSRIIYYADTRDVELSTLLQRLSNDHSWAMSLPVKQPGLQSTSIMILGDLGYYNMNDVKRTPEIQVMIDEMYAIPTNIYKKDYDRSLDVLLRMYKRTVEKHLIWGRRLFT